MIEEGRAWPRRAPTDSPLVLAHRGGTGRWRENTLEAFAGALALGADGVELDVRMAADGTLAVHHDAEVPGVGPVHELRGDQLPQWLPTLEQALSACAGAVVNVEIKNSPGDPGFDPGESVAQSVVASLRAGEGDGAEGPPTRILVSSFSVRTLSAVQQAGGREFALGLLVHPALDPEAALREAAGLGFAALNPFFAQVTPELMSLASEAGMAVFTWTVNEPAAVERMRQAKVDGIITDEVSAALRAMAHEGGLVREARPRGQSTP